VINSAPAHGFHLEAQRHWVVIFFNPPTPRYWIEFLSGKGPRHVALMTYLALPGIWVHLDNGLDGNSLCVVDQETAWRLLSVLERRGATILRWMVPEPKPRQHILAPNCVGWAQRFLGIPGLIWTPPELQRCMINSGALRFFGVSRDIQSQGVVREAP
jgi:hypothetical protein